MAQIAEIRLDSDEQKIGRLWIGRMEDVAFAPSETLIFESIAQQMAIAIEHALMTAQIQSGAIVEERARLAREMHDGLSQILGFLSLEMQSLELLVGQGRINETLAELGRARRRIREAQAEVRENILNLRSALSKDGEAIPFLCEYIQEFGQQTGIEVQISCADLATARLTPICEVQLVRIVQEALTNVRLHAQANHLWARFERKDASLCVQIQDDGIGFVEQTLKKHFGLKSMRERTESVRGRLSIHSQPGEGTCISLCLPLAEQKVAPRQEASYGQTTAA
jgi:signal transduction histidine kinase